MELSNDSLKASSKYAKALDLRLSESFKKLEEKENVIDKKIDYHTNLSYYDLEKQLPNVKKQQLINVIKRAYILELKSTFLILEDIKQRLKDIQKNAVYALNGIIESGKKIPQKLEILINKVDSAINKALEPLDKLFKQDIGTSRKIVNKLVLNTYKFINSPLASKILSIGLLIASGSIPAIVIGLSLITIDSTFRAIKAGFSRHYKREYASLMKYKKAKLKREFAFDNNTDTCIRIKKALPDLFKFEQNDLNKQSKTNSYRLKGNKQQTFKAYFESLYINGLSTLYAAFSTITNSNPLGVLNFIYNTYNIFASATLYKDRSNINQILKSEINDLNQTKGMISYNNLDELRGGVRNIKIENMTLKWLMDNFDNKWNDTHIKNEYNQKYQEIDSRVKKIQKLTGFFGGIKTGMKALVKSHGINSKYQDDISELEKSLEKYEFTIPSRELKTKADPVSRKTNFTANFVKPELKKDRLTKEKTTSQHPNVRM